MVAKPLDGLNRCGQESPESGHFPPLIIVAINKQKFLYIWLLNNTDLPWMQPGEKPVKN